MVEFRRLNFMDSDYGIKENADVIFCRNVIIYFDRATQEQILQKLAHQLAPGGYIFLGHSETLSGIGCAAGVGRTLHLQETAWQNLNRDCRRFI